MTIKLNIDKSYSDTKEVRPAVNSVKAQPYGYMPARQPLAVNTHM